MNDRQRTGIIKVSIARFENTMVGLEAAAGARVDILDKQLRLLQRTNSRTAIDIAPGNYVVAVTLPDGSRYTDTVGVRAGETTPVQLAWSPTPIAAAKVRARSRTEAKGLLAPTPDSFYLRFIEIRDDLEAMPAVALPQKEIEDYFREEGVLDTTMIIYAPPEPHRVHYAEVATERGDAVAVALPTARLGAATRCQLNVVISAERLEVDVRMLGSPDADNVSQFMASGQLEEAAVPEAAEAMLYRKLQHPFGAALSGYALLRLKELDRLHQWPENLASWFDWLPDAHIILGEQHLRDGRMAEAFASFVRALERGLPVFTDGFSIVEARLRSLARGTTTRGIPKSTMNEAGRRLEALSRWTPWVVFDAVYTTKRGGNGPPITKTGGWQRFRPPFGPARDPRDFWSESNG